jgi:hypothetical protein
LVSGVIVCREPLCGNPNLEGAEDGESWQLVLSSDASILALSVIEDVVGSRSEVIDIITA